MRKKTRAELEEELVLLERVIVELRAQNEILRSLATMASISLGEAARRRRA